MTKITGQCAVCKNTAYEVELIASMLTVHSFLGEQFECISARKTETLKNILESHDLAAGYRLQANAFPGYCPDCKRSYCGDHWRLWTLADEGWFEGFAAWCPQGHQKIID